MGRDPERPRAPYDPGDVRVEIAVGVVGGIVCFASVPLVHGVDLADVAAGDVLGGVVLGVLLTAGLSYVAYVSERGRRVRQAVERRWWRLPIAGAAGGVPIALVLGQFGIGLLLVTAAVAWFGHLLVLALLSVRE